MSLKTLKSHFKNMRLTTDDVKKIALLARLDLEPEEEELFSNQLSEVVGYIDQLASYATAEVDPAANGGGPEAADQEAPGLQRDDFLANAPDSHGALLRVPRVKARRVEGREK